MSLLLRITYYRVIQWFPTFLVMLTTNYVKKILRPFSKNTGIKYKHVQII